MIWINLKKKIELTKSTWYDSLINYIPEPIRKSVGGLENKTVNLFKTNTPKETVYGKGKKLSKPKKKKKKLRSLLNQKRTKTKLKIE